MRPALPRFLIVGVLVFVASVVAVCLPVKEAQAFKIDIGFVVDTEDGQIVIVVSGDPDEGDGIVSPNSVDSAKRHMTLQRSSQYLDEDNGSERSTLARLLSALRSITRGGDGARP